MKILLFGATGMIGQGVLRECLLARDVERVLVIGRRPVGQRHHKLRQVIHHDFTDFSSVERELARFDACFFCLGVSAAGMREPGYRRVTYEYTLAAAGTLARRNPGMAFVYVSGQGTDSGGKGRLMWARVKGETENAVLALPLRAYMFRPGFIQPLHGARSSTRFYRMVYRVIAPVTPLVGRLWPGQVITTEQLGSAMLHVARHGASKRVLERGDLIALASGRSDRAAGPD